MIEYSFSSEVSEAVDSGRPIVALESTVIAHGLPFPQNIETALSVENEVRKQGAVPATIAVIKGVPTVGLDKTQLEFLASSPEVVKVSIRDLPIVVANRTAGATTVAGTLFIAHRAGIKVFATGGIGGVHRGDGDDVSADLPALAATPMVVVCAGAKSVLNIASTKEWLETHGIPILGWNTEEFPAFYSISSGVSVDRSIRTAEEVVDIARARDALGIKTSILVGAPVPEELAIAEVEFAGWLDAAITDADKESIKGKELTPFLLSAIADRSEGRTIKTNIGLLLNNARIAARIAVSIV